MRIQQLRWVGVWGGLSLLITSCGVLTRVQDWLMPPDVSALPPCVDDDCDCGDFLSQSQAQVVLDAFAGDPYRLDQDGNGLACELLPPQLPPPPPPAPASSSPHLALGNPSQATPTMADNYLIQRDGYVLSYNRDRNLLNWGSWEVDAAWLGQIDRQDNFRPDGSLPKGFYQVTSDDYSHSGYDRGHLVPSGDRTHTKADNSATFLMTNILPQTPENNRGPWKELENYGRDLVYQYDRSLYVIAGAYGERGSIGRQVTVPSRLWKVIVVLDRFDNGSLGVGPETQIIAVDMPNRNDVDADWHHYLTSIDRIEIATNYDLLSVLPENLQAALEARTEPTQ